MRRLLALGLATLAACGGGASPHTPSSGTVGGGLPDVGPIAPPPNTAQPSPPAAMIAGPSFGIRNDLNEPITWYGWYETRPGVEPISEPHWHYMIPVGRRVAPGAIDLPATANGDVPLFNPEAGAVIDVVAATLSGRLILARVYFNPTTNAIWVVR